MRRLIFSFCLLADLACAAPSAWAGVVECGDDGWCVEIGAKPTMLPFAARMVKRNGKKTAVIQIMCEGERKPGSVVWAAVFGLTGGKDVDGKTIYLALTADKKTRLIDIDAPKDPGSHVLMAINPLKELAMIADAPEESFVIFGAGGEETIMTLTTWFKTHFSQ